MATVAAGVTVSTGMGRRGSRKGSGKLVFPTATILRVSPSGAATLVMEPPAGTVLQVLTLSMASR